MKKNNESAAHSIIGLCIGAILSYAFLCLPYVNDEPLWTLPAFNFLFVSLTFPLNGTLVKKVLLLIIGNFACLLWNYLISLFSYVVVYNYGEFFNTLHIILTPLLNLVLIVSFWSVSLTVLASDRGRVGVGI